MSATKAPTLRNRRLSEFDAGPYIATFGKEATGGCSARMRLPVRTHLAIALGILTAELGHRLFFLSALEMARRLGAALKENRLPHAMRMIPNPILSQVEAEITDKNRQKQLADICTRTTNILVVGRNLRGSS
jgi:hypothetical protein